MKVVHAFQETPSFHMLLIQFLQLCLHKHKLRSEQAIHDSWLGEVIHGMEASRFQEARRTQIQETEAPTRRKGYLNFRNGT